MSRKRRTRKPFDATLPPASCYKELYEKLDNYATAKEISLGDVIRQSVELFLSSANQKVGDKTQKVGE